jgi:hypothetical protein
MVKTRQVLPCDTEDPNAASVQKARVAKLLKHANHVKSLTGPKGAFEGLTVTVGPLTLALAEMEVEDRSEVGTDINYVCETLVYGEHTCATKDNLKHIIKSAVIVDFAKSQFAALSRYHYKWENLREAVVSKGWQLSNLPAKRWKSAAAMLSQGFSKEGGTVHDTLSTAVVEKHVKRIAGQGAVYLEAFLKSSKSADDDFSSVLDVSTDDGKRRLESILVVPGAIAGVCCLARCYLRCLLA